MREFKRHSQLAYISIRRHNLHIIKTRRSILFLTKYDKIKLQDEQNHIQKQVFQVTILNQEITAKIEVDF